ncbi:unnamed protein product, partial [Meganyctiphanes norvegica]
MDFNSDTSRIYPLCNSPRAIAALIYMDDPNFPYGKADVLLSEKLWKTLDCDIRVFANPSRQELEIIIADLKSEINSNPKKHDFFTLTFIGHGGRQHGFPFLNLKNKTHCYVFELDREFATSNCPGLAGKPKLLFLQACRGQDAQTPVEIAMPANGTITRSEMSDFFTLHSTYTGQVSWYDSGSGESYFIRTVCEVFKKEFKDLDIQGMATMVTDKLSRMVIKGFSQTPVVESTLSKLLYFSGVRGANLPEYIRKLPNPNTPNPNTPNPNPPIANLRNFGASSSSNNTLKEKNTSKSNVRAKPRITCEECGTAMNVKKSQQRRSRGKEYYACADDSCSKKNKFIVWNDLQKLNPFIKARENIGNCKCSKSAVRDITSK